MDVPTLMHNLKEEVSCSVCMQLYTEPKQLPCLHIFCLKCLNSIARTSAQYSKIKCLLCQIQVPVPESGTMETLPSCFYLKNLLDILAIKECSTSKVTCRNCQMKSEEASYCFHCGGFWCKACLDAHNILRANADHRVLALKDFQEQDFEVVLKRPAFCQKELHEKEVLKFYCKMCEIPVCQDCVTVEHGKHDVEYLEVTARGVKHNMAAQLQLDAVEKETQILSSCLRELEEKSRGIEQRSQFVKRQIQDTVKSLILNLQQRVRELITEVEKETQIEQDHVTKDKAKISDHLKKIEGTMLQAKHFIDRSTAAELVTAKAFVTELLQELPAPELIASTCERQTLHTVFLENKVLPESLHNTGMGRLHKTATAANQCNVEGFTEATAGLETRIKLITRNAEGKQSYSPGDCVVVELASTEDELAGEMKIVDKKNGSYEVSCIPKQEGEHKVTARVNGEEIRSHPAIHVKKRSYKLLRTVGGAGTGAGEFRGPWGVAVNDKNEIIICDALNNRLQVFNEKGDFIRTHELMTYPTGICIDSTGRNYVTAKNKILLLNPNGDYIKEIRYSDEENQDVNVNWLGMSLDEQGNIIVCNWKNDHRGVHILSPEGKLLNELSRDDFNSFDCLYNERKIFVSNLVSHTIDVFDCEGNFLKEIGKRGSGNGEFRYPTGIAIDKTGNLVVADDNGVQVFTLDGMFITKFGGDVLSYPRGVAVLKDGRVIVTDIGKHQFQIFE